MREFIDIVSENVLDHLREYRMIDTYDPITPTLDDMELVDKMYTRAGEVEVWERKKESIYSFALVQNKEVLAAIDLEQISSTGQFVMFKRAVAFKPRLGLASSLFKWAKRTYRFSVFSDTHMTKEGEAFWFSLMGQYYAKVVNLETQEVYDIPKIDGKAVVDPKYDNNSDETILIDPTKGQKWFYLIETVERGPIHTNSWLGTILPEQKYEKGWGMRHSIPMYWREGVLINDVD